MKTFTSKGNSWRLFLSVVLLFSCVQNSNAQTSSVVGRNNNIDSAFAKHIMKQKTEVASKLGTLLTKMNMPFTEGEKDSLDSYVASALNGSTRDIENIQFSLELANTSLDQAISCNLHREDCIKSYQKVRSVLDSLIECRNILFPSEKADALWELRKKFYEFLVAYFNGRI